MASENKKSDWPVILFVFVVLPIAFTFGGVWVGFGVLAIGVIALGWSKRHDGPFPTNKGMNFLIKPDLSVFSGKSGHQDSSQGEKMEQGDWPDTNSRQVPQIIQTLGKLYC